MKKEGGREAYQKKDEGEKGEKNGVENEGWRDVKKKERFGGVKDSFKKGEVYRNKFLNVIFLILGYPSRWEVT